MKRDGDAAREDLRDRSRRIRDAIDPVLRLERSEAAHTRLYELDRFREAEAVAIYFSTGSEVITGPLAIRLAEHDGKRLLLPFVLNDELQLTDWRPSDPVVDAPYGGMHPRYRRPVELSEVDVVVVSGLAFDRSGNRMGEGRGLVDGLLRRLAPETSRIGLAFDDQIVTEVPVGDHDERVDAIATDTEIIVCDPVVARVAGR